MNERIIVHTQPTGTSTVAKYKLVYDRSCMGDRRLLEQEMVNAKNSQNMTIYLVMVVLLALGTAMCSYLMYQFPTALVLAVFVMLFLAFLWDVVLFRVLFCLVIALWTRRRARLEGGLRFATLDRPSSDEETPRAEPVEEFLNRRPVKDKKVLDEDER